MMMQNRASSVAPYVAVMPLTLGGAKLCLRTGWIASLPSGPRRRHPDAPSRHAEGKPLSSWTKWICPSARSSHAPEPIAGADLVAVRPEIVRTEHDCGSFPQVFLSYGKGNLYATP
jgi:hypothetical protein